MKLITLLLLIAWSCRGEAFLKKIGDLVPKPDDFIPKIPKIPNPLDVVFQNKCIEDLGCFYTGPPFFHPIDRPISLTPTSNLKVHFLLYTPNNPQEPEDLDTTPKSIKESSFNPKYPLKVLIHGFRTELDENDVRFQTKDAFLNSSNYNVIVVDWTENNGPPYPQAVANTRAVGAKLAQLLKVIMKATGYKPQDIHLIGHSLGGQICGYAGERIPKLGRITGLDPAGPYFQNAPKEVRLDTTDALFVDVIHTDGGENFIDGLGLGEPIGHMDFYPNGGNRQPGCAFTSEDENFFGSIVNTTSKVFSTVCSHTRACEYFLESIDKSKCHFLATWCNSYRDFEKGDCLPEAPRVADMATSKVFSTVCSHTRACEYFLESIDNSNCRFLATWCNSYRDFEKGDCLPEASRVAEMGYHAKRIKGVPVKSKFYLRTNDKEPFCIQNSIHLKNDDE